MYAITKMISITSFLLSGLLIPNLYGQSANTDFINQTYTTLTGKKSRYYLADDKDGALIWTPEFKKTVARLCNRQLPQKSISEILENAPQRLIADRWNCDSLLQAICVCEYSQEQEIKDKGDMIFAFENPVFDSSKTHSIVITSIASKGIRSHWLFIFKTKRNKWKKVAKLSMWTT